MMWNLTDFQNSIAVICEGGTRVTYGELQEKIESLVSHVKNRCVVLCMCKNEIGSLVGYVGFINHKIIPLMIDANLDKELIAFLMKTYKPDYVWTPQDKICQVDYVSCDYEADNYSLLKTEYNTVYPLYDELALLLTTSGSTGSPKLVRQTYENLRANTESIIEYLSIDERECSITTLPMNYTYGLSIINTHLYVGASLVLTEKTLMQKEFWQQFKENEVTSFGGVPYIYEMLEKLRFFRMELPSLRTMTQAGGKLSPELHKRFAEFAERSGKKFIVMYGQTEATARMAYLPPEKALEKYGSMGIPIPGGKFTLIDVNGKEILEANTVGELVYEGKNVTLGYATCGEDLIKGDEWNGRNVTGDMAKRDEDGFYYITGRKKRFLKIFGSRVNLDETEQLLKTHFENFESVCAGKDDKMYVFITDNTKLEVVKKFLAEKLSFNSSAFSVHFIQSIPRNESGKIQYKELERYY